MIYEVLSLVSEALKGSIVQIVLREFSCLFYATFTNKHFPLSASLTAHEFSKALHAGLINWMHQSKKLLKTITKQKNPLTLRGKSRLIKLGLSTGGGGKSLKSDIE